MNHFSQTTHSDFISPNFFSKKFLGTRKFLAILFSFILTFPFSIYADFVEKQKYIPLVDCSPQVRIEVKSNGRELINFIKWKRLDLAKRKLSAIEKFNKNSDEYYYLKGSIEFSEGNWEESEKDLLLAVHINPGHDPALFLLGIQYALQEDWESSRDYFKRTLRNAPYSPYYHLNLAYVYFILDDRVNSLLHVEKALRQKPNFDNAIVLSKHLGSDKWEKDFQNINLIGRETRSYLEKGFPDQKSRIDYSMKRIYKYYPFTKK